MQRVVNRQRYDAWKAKGAGLALHSWGSTIVRGDDGPSFLHKFCTNDVLRLAPGEGCEAFFTDVKGKIVAHGALLRATDHIHVLLPAGNVDALVAHLDRYVIRERVAFDAPSPQWGWRLYAGVEPVERGLDRMDLEVALGGPSHDRWRHAAIAANQATGLVVDFDVCGAGGTFLGASESVLSRLDAQAPVGADDDLLWETLRIEEGWPTWSVDFGNENLPQEVDRDAHAISFRKGCYLGQETVARLDALGHVNRMLRRVRFERDAAPAAGVELYASGHSAGVVTSSCWSPKFDAPVAWAMVRRNALPPDGSFASSAGGATLLI